MPYTLTFEDLLEYDAGKESITIPATLRLGETYVSVEAKLDTGSTFCVFQRLQGELLGLDIESGFPEWIGTAMGSF